MKVVELPKPQTEAESARAFLAYLTELVDKGEYKPVAFIVCLVEENGLTPLGCNLTRHETISYLEITKASLVDATRNGQ